MPALAPAERLPPEDADAAVLADDVEAADVGVDVEEGVVVVTASAILKYGDEESGIDLSP